MRSSTDRCHRASVRIRLHHCVGQSVSQSISQSLKQSGHLRVVQYGCTRSSSCSFFAVSQSQSQSQSLSQSQSVVAFTAEVLSTSEKTPRQASPLRPAPPRPAQPRPEPTGGSTRQSRRRLIHGPTGRYTPRVPGSLPAPVDPSGPVPAVPSSARSDTLNARSALCSTATPPQASALDSARHARPHARNLPWIDRVSPPAACSAPRRFHLGCLARSRRSLRSKISW